MIPWLCPTAPFLSLALLELSGAPKLTADIYPSRWKPRVSLEDALLTMLSDLHNQTSKQPWMASFSEWGRHIGTHPDAAVGAGGLSIHAGLPAAGALPVRLTPTNLILPDGRSYPRALFSQHTAYRSRSASQACGALSMARTLSGEESPYQRAQIAEVAIADTIWGVLSAWNGQPFGAWSAWTDLPRVGALVGGLAARLLAVCGRSGAAARAWGEREGDIYARHLLQAWALRPNRAWMAQTWTTCAIEAMNGADPLYVEAGHAAGTVVLEQAASGADLRVLCDSHRDALDDALCGALLRVWAADTARLKPQAARAAARPTMP